MSSPPPIPSGYSSQTSGPLPYASGNYQANSLADQPGMKWILPVGRSGWAIAAGYLGLLSFIVLPAPIAVIISIVAIMDLKRHPTRSGWGRAIFGLVAGSLFTILLLVMIVAQVFGR